MFNGQKGVALIGVLCISAVMTFLLLVSLRQLLLNEKLLALAKQKEAAFLGVRHLLFQIDNMIRTNADMDCQQRPRFIDGYFFSFNKNKNLFCQKKLNGIQLYYVLEQLASDYCQKQIKLWRINIVADGDYLRQSYQFYYVQKLEDSNACAVFKQTGFLSYREGPRI